MTDHDHTHRIGHQPSAHRDRLNHPIARLWSLAKGSAERHGNLHTHDMGFELRILDEHGESTFTQVRGSESEIVMLAASHQDRYLAEGWVRLEPR